VELFSRITCLITCVFIMKGPNDFQGDCLEEGKMGGGKGMSSTWGNRVIHVNPLTPNDHYSGLTAPLTSECCILYIYSTNTGTEYFKHGIYSPFFSLQKTVCFIILTYLVPVLFKF